MLHIILVILKIVGILLAAILLILLLALCSALFVSFRYRLYAAKGTDGFCVQGRVTWLLRLFSLTVTYRDGKPELLARIFFWKKSLLADGEEPPSKEQKPPARKKPVDTGKTRDTGTPKKEPPKKEPPKQQDGKVSLQKPRAPQTDSKKPEQKAAAGESAPEKQPPPQKQAKRRRSPIQSFREKLTAVRSRIKALTAAVKSGLSSAEDGIAFLRSDMVKAVLGRVKGHLRYLWKHLKPDRLWGDLRYGFEDPSLTGQLTGLLYVLLSLSFCDLSLQPDFDRAVLSGEIHVKGHIRLCHLAWVGWKLFRDKEVRKIYQLASHGRQKEFNHKEES